MCLIEINCILSVNLFEIGFCLFKYIGVDDLRIWGLIEDAHTWFDRCDYIGNMRFAIDRRQKYFIEQKRRIE